jgi:hypothetical protein
MSARNPTDSMAATPDRKDRPVTIQELCTSSRVLFWVPPQLMAEFFGLARRAAAPPQPKIYSSDADESARPALACAAAR